jgi:hypothetical protein
MHWKVYEFDIWQAHQNILEEPVTGIFRGKKQIPLKCLLPKRLHDVTIQIVWMKPSYYLIYFNFLFIWRMVSSGMLCHVALVRTDVSEETSASFIKVTRIGELGTTQAATGNRCTRRRNLVLLRSVLQLLVAACVVPSSPILVTLMKEALGSSETSVLTRSTWHNIPEDTILHSHHRENLKSYILFICLYLIILSVT